MKWSFIYWSFCEEKGWFGSKILFFFSLPSLSSSFKLDDLEKENSAHVGTKLPFSLPLSQAKDFGQEEEKEEEEGEEEEEKEEEEEEEEEKVP